MTKTLRNLLILLVREWRIRRALNAAGALDDWALKDVGLQRGNLENAVRYGRDLVRSADVLATGPLRSKPDVEANAAEPRANRMTTGFAALSRISPLF